MRKNFHLGDSSLIPKIEITTSTGKHLSADNTSNSISAEFNTFVINNPLQPKANAKTYLGRLISNPTIEIKPTTLVHTIPPKKEFTYKLSQIRRSFGANGKVLPNISFILNNGYIMAEIASLDLARIKTQRWKGYLDAFVDDINSQKGTTIVLQTYINNNASEILKMGPFPPTY